MTPARRPEASPFYAYTKMHLSVYAATMHIRQQLLAQCDNADER